MQDWWRIPFSCSLNHDRLEGGPAGAPGLRWGLSFPPIGDPHQVDGGGRHEVLPLGLGRSQIAAPAPAAAPDRLFMRTLKTGSGGYCCRNSAVVGRCRAACRASYCSRSWSRIRRGSFFALVPGERNRHGAQCWRAKRASPLIPFCGSVFGRKERLCLPAGQVTVWCSPSTGNGDLSKPAPARAGQLGSSATGPTTVTPDSRWLWTSTGEPV